MRGLGRKASAEKWVGEGRLREWGAERLMRGRGHGGARREGLPGGSGGHRPSADPAARLAAAGAPGSHPRRTRAFRSRPGPHPHGVPTRLGRPCSQSRQAVGTRAAGALVDRRGCAPASSCRVARGWAWKGPGDLGGTPRAGPVLSPRPRGTRTLRSRPPACVSAAWTPRFLTSGHFPSRTEGREGRRPRRRASRWSAFRSGWEPLCPRAPPAALAASLGDVDRKARVSGLAGRAS